MKSLKPEKLLNGLKTKSFGRSLLCFEKVTSTNDVMLKLGEAGCVEGTVVTAEFQTQGRGRQGRSWSSTKGKGLVFSLLLRPKLHPDEISEITLAASVAVSKTLEGFRLKAQIKWPNDLLLGGKKVCGILTEMGAEKDKIASVVLGIGVNLNQATMDFPRELREQATSVYRFSRTKVDRVRFLQALLRDLEETYHWVEERRFSKVLGEWRKRSITLGQQVKVTQANHVFYGQVMDIDVKGALLVRTDIGMVEKITSGDVEVVYPKPRKRLS